MLQFVPASVYETKLPDFLAPVRRQGELFVVKEMSESG